MMSAENITTSGIPESIKDDDSAPLFPIQRFYHYTNVSRDYYAYDNGLPEDLLESCSDHEPSILSLGCGDIHSCFYSLWKHFDDTISSAPIQFDKVRFTLVDQSPAVMARNIIFIYLSVNLPDKKCPRKKWLCGMWAIWYCHTLSSDHAAMLSVSLNYLTKFTDSLQSWDSEENMLKSIIQFESASSLAKISEVLNMWHTESINVRSIQMMQKSRKKRMSEPQVLEDMSWFHHTTLARMITFFCGKVESKECLNTQVSELQSYIQSGNAFAEPIFEMDLQTQAKVNFTLYEETDGTYTLHYGSVPFRAYQHTFQLTPEKLAPVCLNTSDVLVSSKHFPAKPFLANSFQQFILWIQSVSRILNKESIKVNFVLSTQDAITFCYKWQYSKKHSTAKMSEGYSAIYTSNLMDHVGLPNVVLSGVPLLKKEAILFTTSTIARNCTSTIEELLKKCFGFDCSLLPVLFGVRCINHEGKDFSSSVMSQPCPPDIANSEPRLPHVRKLKWDNICGAQPLKFSELPGNISDALVNLTATCAFSYFNSCPDIATCNTIETAILMLKFFIHHIDKTKMPDISFWNCFTSALSKVARPFLLSLQTHLLLHEVHIHLILSEKECPLCNNIPIQDVIGLFSVSISKADLSSIRIIPLFYVIFYENSLPNDAEELFKASERGENVHVFDCFDGISTNEKVELKFYVPLQVLQQKYKLAAFVVCPIQGEFRSFMEKPLMEDKCLVTMNHSFFQAFVKEPPAAALLPLNQEFVEVAFHNCNEYDTKTKLSLSKPTSGKIETERASVFDVRLFSSSFSFLLSYNYPTGHEEVEVIDLPGKSSIEIITKRLQHSFENEHMHYIVSPDHQLSLPHSKDSYNVIKIQANMQFTREEFADKLHVPEQELKPLVRVKMVIEKIFKWSKFLSYIQICSPNRSEFILIAVNSILFDYQVHTPALDLAFCITENHATVAQWDELVSNKFKEEILEEAQIALLKTTLIYFAKRTNGTLQTCHNSTVFENICGKNICQMFSRAVIYFLFFDPDKNIPTETDVLKPPLVAGSNCEHCSKFSYTFKRCARCHSVYYCSRECQKSNWKLHRQKCKTRSHQELSTHYTMSGFFLKPVASQIASTIN